MDNTVADETRSRASRSGGTSADAIYKMVARALQKRNVRGAIAVDLGCGRGALKPLLESAFPNYVGVDALRYDNFPSETEFIEADLNAHDLPLQSQSADAVFAIETIEHLENPRAFIGEMARIAKPGGWIVVTTPNQLSWLSLTTLIFKDRFSAFQDAHYPAHLTALLECDLLRMAAETGLREARIEYSLDGRIVLTSVHYPRFLTRLFPRRCSDNVLLIGRTP
jgi:2-polyprenyl-3-methyl-5-hydroxy-6-metoxy-1,4-benzoquinol methylase